MAQQIDPLRQLIALAEDARQRVSATVDSLLRSGAEQIKKTAPAPPALPAAPEVAPPKLPAVPAIPNILARLPVIGRLPIVGGGEGAPEEEAREEKGAIVEGAEEERPAVPSYRLRV